MQSRSLERLDDIEYAVAENVDWYNHRRLNGEIELVPPAEYETHHYSAEPSASEADARELSLH